MIKSIRKYIIHVLFLLSTLVLTSCVNVHTNTSISNENFTLRELLNEKIEYYRHQYPEITFINLMNTSDLEVLEVVLGHKPESLDYEHPADLREDLMLVSVERIWSMLQTKQPSAALFKVDTPLGWNENVCVLTINPEAVATNSYLATQHLLNLPETMVRKIPYKLQLKPGDYLSFVVDHEVNHCLTSMYVGPQQMSNKALWGQYSYYHNELAADAYAIAVHIKYNDTNSSFRKNILRIRGMSLYNDDPNHLTCKAIKKVLKISPGRIKAMTTHEIFNLANKIKDELTINYRDYVKYLASAVQAMKELGVKANVSDETLYALQNIKADPAQVKTLINDARVCYTSLCPYDFSSTDCE